MEKIKSQASKVSELVFAPDTGATYKKTVALTWAILRETGVLLWLVICLAFVGGEWFWKNSIHLGRRARVWYQDFQSPSSDEPKTPTEIGQSAVTALSNGAETLLYNAKKQLGIDAAPLTPKPPKAKTVSPPEPATATPESAGADSESAAAATPEAKPAIASAAEQANNLETDSSADTAIKDED